MLTGILTWLGGFIVKTLTGGSLDGILSTIDKHMDADVEKEKIKAEVTKTYVTAQSQLLVGRTWWFQLFFVLPLGVHWAALNWVSAFPQFGWTVFPLPHPFDEWATYIISALFIVDGAKAVGNSILKRVL